MKNFKDITEGLLAGQEETLKVGDATAKEIAEAKDIIKLIPTIDNINDRAAMGMSYACSDTDAMGVKVKKGDLVCFTEGNFIEDDGLRYGIVVDFQPNVYGYTVLAGKVQYEEDEQLDLYPNCYAHFVDARHMVVLARQKDAAAMLKLLSKLK